MTTRPGPSAQSSRRKPGRPRSPGTDVAVLRAAADLLAERGVSGVTLSGVAARAGVARATVYRRWPSRQALIAAATKAVVGGEPYAMTGEIERDLREGADFAQAVLAAPYFAAILPELVRAVLEGDSEVTFEALAPNRASLARSYLADAATQGFDPRRHPNLAFDLQLGAGLTWLLATGTPPSPAYMREAVDVILRGLRPSGAAPTGQKDASRARGAGRRGNRSRPS